MTRGLFLALTDAELEKLRASRGDPARRGCLAEFEEALGAGRMQDTDKAWYALYVMFTFGPLNQSPLDQVFAGGKRLHRADYCLINLIEQENREAISAALSKLTKPKLEEAFEAVSPGYFPSRPDKSPAAFRCLWDWYSKIRRFLRSVEGHVVFNAEFQ